MAILFDTSSNSGDFTTSTFSWSHTVGTGSNGVLFVVVTLQGSGTNPALASTVKYNTVSMTKVATSAGLNTPAGSWKNQVTVWMLLNPPSGAHSVAVTVSTVASLNPDYGAAAYSYFGANQSLTPDATAINTANTTGNLVDTLTTVASGAWIIAGMNTMNDGTTAGTTTSSQTQRQSFVQSTNINGRHVSADTNGTVAPGSNTMTFNFVGGTSFVNAMMTSAAVSFAPAVTIDPSNNPAFYTSRSNIQVNNLKPLITDY